MPGRVLFWMSSLHCDENMKRFLKPEYLNKDPPLPGFLTILSMLPICSFHPVLCNLLRAPMGCFYTAFIVFIQLSLISHTSPSHSFPLTFPSPSHDFPRSYLFALISMSHLPCMTSCCSWSVSWSRCRVAESHFVAESSCWSLLSPFSLNCLPASNTLARKSQNI